MTNIFVGNLSYQTTQEDLQQAFSQYGGVERVNIVTDRDSGQPRGFAFVEMTERRDAETAIAQLNGAEMNGRALNVNEARPKPAGGGGGASTGGAPKPGGGAGAACGGGANAPGTGAPGLPITGAIGGATPTIVPFNLLGAAGPGGRGAAGGGAPAPAPGGGATAPGGAGVCAPC